jgi:hypothetical protein
MKKMINGLSRHLKYIYINSEGTLRAFKGKEGFQPSYSFTLVDSLTPHFTTSFPAVNYTLF